MSDWVKHAAEALESDQQGAIVTVCGVSGSAPREAGTKMIVTAKKQWGTIGGGNLEYQAIDQARKLLDHVAPDFVIQDFPLGPLLGQCCGGYVRLAISRLRQSDQHWLGEVRSRNRVGKTALIETIVGDDKKVFHRVSDATDEIGVQTVACVADNQDIDSLDPKKVPKEAIKGIREVAAPPKTSVYLFGAGHVGKAVARALEPLPMHVTWIDTRPDYVQTNAGKNFSVHHSDDLVGDVAGAPAGAIFLVFTHSHDLDYQVVRAILSRDDFRYCGLIGSRTKRMSFEKRLRDAGLSDAILNRLVCPIGPTSLKSKDPSVIAVGVAAELLAYIEPGTGAVADGS